MKKILLPVIATLIYATTMPSFSADTTAMQETTPPAASGPLDTSSITPPKDAMPKAPAQQPKGPGSMYAPQPNASMPGIPAQTAAPSPAAPTPPAATPSPVAVPAPATPAAPAARSAAPAMNAQPSNPATPVLQTAPPTQVVPGATPSSQLPDMNAQ